MEELKREVNKLEMLPLVCVQKIPNYLFCVLFKNALITLQQYMGLVLFCPICVCWPIRVWDVPYAYTHMGRPYAYGTTSCPI